MCHLSHWKRNVKDGLVNNEVVRGLVNESLIHADCRAVGHDWRSSFWCPGMVVVAFLLQVIDGAKTLRAAVAVLFTHLAARGGRALPSADPSAYCQARQRLPAAILHRLLERVTDQLGQVVSSTSQWLGHRLQPDSPAHVAGGARAWLRPAPAQLHGNTAQNANVFACTDPQRRLSTALVPTTARLDRARYPAGSTGPHRAETSQTAAQSLQ